MCKKQWQKRKNNKDRNREIENLRQQIGDSTTMTPVPQFKECDNENSR